MSGFPAGLLRNMLSSWSCSCETSRPSSPDSQTVQTVHLYCQMPEDALSQVAFEYDTTSLQALIHTRSSIIHVQADLVC